MALYEKFGISPQGVNPAGHLRAVETYERQVAKKTADLWLDLRGLACNRAVAAVRFYLVDDHINARKIGSEVLNPTYEYFFGDWREHKKTDLGTIDPAWWHDKESWMQVFSGALLWGTTLSKWDDLHEIAEYPDDHRKVDSDDDGTPALKQTYVDLARLLRGEHTDGIGARVEKLKGADSHATAVLAHALDAIAGGDQAATDQLLNEFFRRRHKRKMSKSIMDSISPDGTTVVNLARHRGLEVKLQPDLELYYLNLNR